MTPSTRATHVAGVVRWLIVGGSALAALYAWRGYGSLPTALPTAASPVSAAAPERWTCPMHPEILRDHNEPCPLCGMDLVKVETGETTPAPVEGRATVVLDERRRRNAGIRTVKVERRSLQEPIRAIGTVVPDERRSTAIAVREQGWVVELAPISLGSFVRTGERLGSYRSPSLSAAVREWRLLRASGADAAMVAGVESRLALLGLDEADRNALVSGDNGGELFSLRAPASGTLVRRTVTAGEAFAPGQTLFELSDLDDLRLSVTLPESELMQLRVGMPATFEPRANPGTALAARIDLLAPALDPASRSGAVRLRLVSPARRLRAGMSGDVRIDRPGQSALRVPNDAIIDTGEARYVFVALDGGRYEPRPIKTGASTTQGTEVLEGLGDGEEVVVAANFLLDSESRLRALQTRSGEAR